MTTKCFYIENSAECAEAVRLIENSIPCFTWVDLLEDGGLEFTISCREEDTIFVHKTIAPFV